MRDQGEEKGERGRARMRDVIPGMRSVRRNAELTSFTFLHFSSGSYY